MLNVELDKEIIEVENPVYMTDEEIYKKYKGFHFLVTNLKLTEPREPDGWVGGTVRYYSKNYQKMNKLTIITDDIEEFGESLLSFSPGDNAAGFIGMATI